VSVVHLTRVMSFVQLEVPAPPEQPAGADGQVQLAVVPLLVQTRPIAAQLVSDSARHEPLCAQVTSVLPLHDVPAAGQLGFDGQAHLPLGNAAPLQTSPFVHDDVDDWTQPLTEAQVMRLPLASQ
jgi:hypothetical protein